MRVALFPALGLLLSFAPVVVAQEMNRYTERVPVATVRMEKQQVTTYVQQPSTERREYKRVVYDPVVTYQCQRRVHGLLNPFTGPYSTFHMVPIVNWQPRTETVHYDVTRYRSVPQTTIVERPVRYLGFEDRTRLVPVQQESIAPRAIAQNVTPAPARLPQRPQQVHVANTRGVGGVYQVERDPPRQAMLPTSFR